MTAEELEVVIAVMRERLGRIEQAIKIRDKEVERRLVELNHEAARVAKSQSVSVTAEKFDDYKATSQRALELALGTIQDKFNGRADSNMQAHVELATRVLRVETDMRSNKAASDLSAARMARSSDHRVTWLVGIMGLAVILIVTAVNLIINKTP